LTYVQNGNIEILEHNNYRKGRGIRKSRHKKKTYSYFSSFSRHNALRDCLYSLGQQPGLSVQREPQNLLQDGTGDKPADVLFGSFYHGRNLCVDVTIIHSFPLFSGKVSMQAAM
jgi:hypothetical protein